MGKDNSIIAMTLHQLNTIDSDLRKEALSKCCGSSSWVNKMLKEFPVEDLVDLLENAEEKWYECSEQDWKEAFSHHPQIGDMESLAQKFATTAQWAQGEQASVRQADENTLKALAEANRLYKERFGYIFIVCATGLSAEKMLTMLQLRLQNTPLDEIKIAADEQNKITKLRLEKLVAD
jgi:2-oxo-4-hydroxy-4-carboxy-5-ureidoimidazoline decarboxylase